MILDGIDAGEAWLATALLLGIGELVVPGVFLVFLAIAAALTGAVTLAEPAFPIVGQIVSFAIWSVIAVVIGRRWYGRYPVESSDPGLNDRARRLVGQVVRVVEPIADGEGRVRVGDGSWTAVGMDAERGARVRIIGIRDGLLEVEPVAHPDRGAPGL